MRMSKHKFLALLIGIVCLTAVIGFTQAPPTPPPAPSPQSSISSSTTVSAADQANVKQALEKLSKTTGHDVTATDVQTTPIPGLLQVTSNANVFYVSNDGQYVVVGEILDTNKDLENWSLTEKAMRLLRVDLLSKLPETAMIIFPANGDKIGTVTVFTDIDCGYCREMHKHIKEYNDLGIEIRYVAYPRSGPGTPSFEKAETVWCSKNRQGDLTLAKQGKDLPKNICESNPVEMEFELGKKLGVTGTPTLFLANGAKIPGFLLPEDLKKAILKE